MDVIAAINPSKGKTAPVVLGPSSRQEKRKETEEGR
jgi:hypothetical protein